MLPDDREAAALMRYGKNSQVTAMLPDSVEELENQDDDDDRKAGEVPPSPPVIFLSVGDCSIPVI